MNKSPHSKKKKKSTHQFGSHVSVTQTENIWHLLNSSFSPVVGGSFLELPANAKFPRFDQRMCSTVLLQSLGFELSRGANGKNC